MESWSNARSEHSHNNTKLPEQMYFLRDLVVITVSSDYIEVEVDYRICNSTHTGKDESLSKMTPTTVLSPIQHLSPKINTQFIPNSS